MKKLLLTTSLVLAAFATPAMAEGCTDMIAKFDSVITDSAADNDIKMKAIELREEGAKQQAAGDEKSCVATLSTALEALNG
jgi:hypothetical protein